MLLGLALEKDAEAGKILAKKLSAYRSNDNVIVLALPRGGVPVAYEVAKALHAPFDLMLVRKLGVPGQEEVALGAIALPDICALNASIIKNSSVSQEDVDRVIEEETKELLRRNRIYRNDAPPPILKDKIVILIDDGMATGADMRAALMAARMQKPLQIVVAVPIAPKDTLLELQQSADDVVCLYTPLPFFAVGQAYEDFSQTSDDEVLALLKKEKR